MTKTLNSDQIRIYLDDLREIRTEHGKGAVTCPDCDKFGHCVFISTIAVEIMTYERKLAEIV